MQNEKAGLLEGKMIRGKSLGRQWQGNAKEGGVCLKRIFRRDNEGEA